MKRIKLTYRAQFRQPLDTLNPLGAKLSGPVDVEVFEHKIAQWMLRSPLNGVIFKELPSCASATEARRQAAATFAEQLGEWQPFCGNAALLPADFVIRNDGTAYRLEPEDFTHVQRIGAAASRTEALAACGALLPFKRFTNLNSGPLPTCHKCAAYAAQHQEAVSNGK